MSTNKIALRTVEQFMSDYTPIYNPLYPLFLSKSQQYAPEVGRLDFRRVDAVGDIRAKHITPKDTEIQQVAVMEGKKSFRKYFLAKQYVHSQVQDLLGVENVVSQVLDENQKLMDSLVLLGEGTSGGNVINNGLFYSGDQNYTLQSSTAISATDRLLDFHGQVASCAELADQVAGRKVIIFYGTDIIQLFNGLHSGNATPVKTALQDVLGQGFSMVQMPRAVTPIGANGWIIANMDQCKMHYTALPQLMAQGHNEEKMYYWHNFLMGSCMLEVLAKDGIIHQPATLA